MCEWEKKGCTVCRKLWETGEQPPRIGISLFRQSYLHRCDSCGCYWEQSERHADQITTEQASMYFENLFQGKHK
jgi:hypothetical protein